jgi:hypothetical protein
LRLCITSSKADLPRLTGQRADAVQPRGTTEEHFLSGDRGLARPTAIDRQTTPASVRCVVMLLLFVKRRWPVQLENLVHS